MAYSKKDVVFIKALVIFRDLMTLSCQKDRLVYVQNWNRNATAKFLKRLAWIVSIRS